MAAIKYTQSSEYVVDRGDRRPDKDSRWGEGTEKQEEAALGGARPKHSYLPLSGTRGVLFTRARRKDFRQA